MNKIIFRFFSSLRLTIFLLVCSIALVFFATLDQVHWGILLVQQRYFEAWFAAWPLDTQPALHLPLPGGFTLGVLLLVNLTCAHFRHFRLRWSKLGIAIIHAGIVVLLIGGFFTASLQEESSMEIPTGESRDFVIDRRQHELLVRLAPAADGTGAVESVIPAKKISDGTDAQIALSGDTLAALKGTELTLRVKRYWANATVGEAGKIDGAEPVTATGGVAAEHKLAIRAEPPTFKADTLNHAAALVEVSAASTPLGTWLLSDFFFTSFPPQRFEHQGRVYELALRFHREQLPFALRLDKFTHEYYPGSDVPKNFSSAVRIQDPTTHSERPVTISMNHPLRHGGLTFYQAQFRSGNGTDVTILQVVRNPGRLLPYVALYLVGIGLLVQFLAGLVKFSSGWRSGAKTATAPTQKTTPTAPKQATAPIRKARLAGAALAVLVVAGAAVALLSGSPAGADKLLVNRLAGLPVQYNGRLQPIDTLARNTLLILRGKQSVAFTKAEAVAFGKKPSTWSDADKAALAAEGIALPADALALLETRPVPLETRFGRSSLDPVAWLMEVAFRPQVAANFRVFRIENDDVRALLVKRAGAVAYYSWNDLVPAANAIDAKSGEAFGKPASERTTFERGIVKLSNAVTSYDAIAGTFAPVDLAAGALPAQEYQAWLNTLSPRLPLPPEAAAQVGEMRAIFLKRYRSMAQEGHIGIAPPRLPEEVRHGRWANLGETLLAAADKYPLEQPPIVPRYGDLYAAYRHGETEAALTHVAALGDAYRATAPELPAAKIAAEVVFNRVEPFFKILCLYVAAFLLVCAGWVANSRRVLAGARWAVAGIFLLHTVALVARMWIQGRPPVTNLYSSAVFVAWGAVLLGVVVERFLKNGIGSAAAAIVGFASLIIAHHLAMSGDTLNMMVAVLDSNFWLTTHVVTITFGYAAMFVAGLLGALFLVLRVCNRLDATSRASLERVVYGVMCFATLLSFTGTMLGGVWADQSWGRFWGWDPKENGALLIVLWCAVYLHTRWGRLLGATGLMQLVVVGNIITAASWFGTNLLGVGLHSYGFTESGFFWLSLFWASQVAVLALGWLRRGGAAAK
ncbi:MAG: cytochrome c biogenesis protein ResB [Puniceicoccales bacterium]|jgi:ABC-type transport system involved in cytochrome c biogenesis permease subunit|nr:cytochrome c biogenesis protein ResB [Puniceicoccales bacterium]